MFIGNFTVLAASYVAGKRLHIFFSRLAYLAEFLSHSDYIPVRPDTYDIVRRRARRFAWILNHNGNGLHTAVYQ